MIEITHMGEIRHRVYTLRSLEGVLLDPERGHELIPWLESQPAEVLATGVQWRVDGQEIDAMDAEDHERAILSICGLDWWEGGATLPQLAWSCGPRWECLHRFEADCPHDMRPREAIRHHWLYAHGMCSESEWDDARSDAWLARRSAAESVALSAVLSAAESAAESAAWYAARYAARSDAWSDAWLAARSDAWSAAWKRYRASWDVWAVELGR